MTRMPCSSIFYARSTVSFSPSASGIQTRIGETENRGKRRLSALLHRFVLSPLLPFSGSPSLFVSTPDAEDTKTGRHPGNHVPRHLERPTAHDPRGDNPVA